MVNASSPAALEIGAEVGNNSSYKGRSRRSDLYCDHCHLTGHTKAVCYKLIGYPLDYKFKKKTGSYIKENKTGKGNPNPSDIGNQFGGQSANFAGSSHMSKDDVKWIVDSGASSHMEDELQSSYIENNAQSFNIPAPDPSSSVPSMDSSSMGDASVSESSTLQSLTVPVTRLSSRTTKTPIWMHDYVSTSKGSTHCCYPVSDVEAGSTNEDILLVDPTQYQRLVGKLLYLTMTRVDIAYVVQVLSQFMHSPKQSHMNAALRVVKYIKNAPGLGLLMPSDSSGKFVAYCDSTWGSCLQTRRSVTGYLVKFGNAIVSWKSKKQETVARSSAEAEFRSMASVVAEVTWLIGC
uniref:Reverse transcriptase Ty1/copia-type domain-containing protein n=1 Tax=Solanum lycopersicum TaxID=4081 RepID=A0A3Q7H9F9_SOLLC